MSKLPLNLCSNAFSFLLSHFPFSCISILLHLLLSIPISILKTGVELNFRLCNMSPRSMSIDRDTKMQFWTSKKPDPKRPCLVLIHGFGGDSKWQFLFQIRQLSRSFNMYVPDLLFFGKSHTKRNDMSDRFQAICVGEGMKRLGVEKYSVVGISYGGYVAYRMAEIYEEVVMKVVIVSCGICSSDEQKGEQLKKIGRDAVDLLVPETAQDLMTLMKLSIFKYDLSWLPDCLVKELLREVMNNKHKKERKKLAKHLLSQKADPNLPILTQESLIIWGDKDRVFPPNLAHQLQRHLGHKSELQILKDTGHAVNIDSPHFMTSFIITFLS